MLHNIRPVDYVFGFTQNYDELHTVIYVTAVVFFLICGY